MRFRFILTETWTSLRRNVPMLLSVMLVTFISFLFIGASLLTQAQITKARYSTPNIRRTPSAICCE